MKKLKKLVLFMNLQHLFVHLSIMFSLVLFSPSHRAETRMMFLYLVALLLVGPSELPDSILSYFKTKILPEMTTIATTMLLQ